MRTQNNVLIQDTETVGTFARPLVHDWAWHIIDKDFNVLVQKRYLVEEFHKEQTWILATSDFYGSKSELYDTAIEENSVAIAPWREIVKDYINDLKAYKVKVISAYNLAFDYKAINCTNEFFNKGDQKLTKLVDKKTLLCLWNLACDTVLDTDDYRNYADMHEFISAKGNYLTNAEACYAYLSGKDDFQEEHTALADVEIETEILKHIVQNCRGKVEYGLAYACWRKVQNEPSPTEENSKKY